MGRPRKPYFRESDGWWVSRFRGKYVKLAKGSENEAAANKCFHELMALEAIGTPVESPNVTVAAILETFLDWSSRNNEAKTYEWYKMFLQSFCDVYGAERVQDLKPFHVTRWLSNEKGWGASSQRCAITAIKRALNWATDEGFIPGNPLKKVKKPPAKRRDKILAPHEDKALTEAVKDEAFSDFRFAMKQTGRRPGDVAGVTADMVDLDAGTWVLTKHKTFKKKGPQTVYLTPAMVELCRKLKERHPEGPLFRNTRGEPWTANAIRCRMRNLRKRLNLDKRIVAYTHRHTYITDAQAANIPNATIAELVGTSALMIDRHYGHLSQKVAHLRAAAERAAGQREGA